MIARSTGSSREHPLDDVECDVHHGEVGRSELCADLDRDAVRRRVLAGRLERDVVDVDRTHGREAELRRGDGEDAGAAADVEQARRLDVLQQLEAEPRRRVRARAERAAGIDDDGDRLGRRLLPRWPDPERPTRTPWWNARQPSSQPSATSSTVDDVEAERRLVGVDGVRAVELLDALGEDVEQQRELRLAADDDVPVQRNALLSLSKSPSALSYVRSSACSSNSRSRRRCSSVELPRYEDVDEDPLVAAAAALQHGHAAAAQDDDLARLRARLTARAPPRRRASEP